MGDGQRREHLYKGDIFLFNPCQSTLALVEHARSMIEEVFGEDPCRAQYRLPVERFVELGAPLKPRFIHHPRTKGLIRDVIEELGCDLGATYLDVPRLRLATSDEYLTAGIGYALHPHRDTWYSAPMCQLNWWLPIYDFTADSGMAFHPRYMTEPVANGSGRFNYYRWNADGRKNAARHVKVDTRDQPKPEQSVELDPQIRIVCKAGGVILFSAAHLHSTVPNTSGLTRFSIDFRTVSYDDVLSQRGALNVDSSCTGTSLRDFVRGSDMTQLPEDAISLYDDGSAGSGITVFTPEAHDSPGSVSLGHSRG